MLGYSVKLRFYLCCVRMRQKMEKACKHTVVLPCLNVIANAASGSLHGLIGVNVNLNAAPVAIKQTGTLTFLRKFGARQAENHMAIYLYVAYTFTCRVCIRMSHIYRTLASAFPEGPTVIETQVLILTITQ